MNSKHWYLILFQHTMTIPPDCSAVHMLMMGAIPMVVPWKYTPLQQRTQQLLHHQSTENFHLKIQILIKFFKNCNEATSANFFSLHGVTTEVLWFREKTKLHRSEVNSQSTQSFRTVTFKEFGHPGRKLHLSPQETHFCDFNYFLELN